MNDMEAMKNYLLDNIENGDMLITMRAGDVHKIGLFTCSFRKKRVGHKNEGFRAA